MDLFEECSTKQKVQWICKCTDSYLKGEVCIGEGDALDLHSLSWFSVPFAPSIARPYAKRGTIMHPLCEKAVLCPKAVYLGYFENVTLFWLLLTVALQIIIRSVPLGEGMPALLAAGTNTVLHLLSDKLTDSCS